MDDTSVVPEDNNISYNLLPDWNNNDSLYNGTFTSMTRRGYRISTVGVIFYIFKYGRNVTCSLAVLTNILILITMAYSRKSWRFSTGLLMVTLASVDIIGNGLELVYNVLGFTKIVVPHCIVIGYLRYSAFNLSNLIMMLISLNRYALVCRPFTHRNITSRKSTILQLTFITVSCFVFNIYLFFVLIQPYSWCKLRYISGNRYVLSVILRIIVYVVISNILPLVVTGVLTGLVIRELSRSSETLGDIVNVRRNAREAEKNLTKAMIAVNVAFIVLILPFLIVNITAFIANPGFSFYSRELFLKINLARTITTFIQNINYSINFILYILYIPVFKSAFCGIFNSKCKKRRYINNRI